MKMNEGIADRVIRALVGIGVIVAAWLWLGLADVKIAGIIVAIVGAILLLTGIVGFCPAYRLVKLSTRRTHTGAHD